MPKFTQGKKQKVLSKYGGLCFYCRKHKAKTIDHWIPLSKGGKNNLENLVPACMTCNNKKGNHRPTIDIETAWNSNLKPWEYEVKKVWNMNCSNRHKNFRKLSDDEKDDEKFDKKIHPYKVKSLNDIF